MVQRFVVYWNRPGYGMAFEADHYAASPAEARAAHARIFPGDRVKAVKLPRGNRGRFV